MSVGTQKEKCQGDSDSRSFTAQTDGPEETNVGPDNKAEDWAHTANQGEV